ncbi:MAG: phosphoenolpyruvate--protein phosphotransferase [Deltaproteobacteria bacterium]|nr:phosphoenolpyruvate--protein phosphotransferase [Deltaproteobacteria bacterium]
MQIHTLSSHDVVSEIMELADLCRGEEDVRRVLHLLVEKLKKIMNTDVCSLYLLDPKSKNLVLAATQGLNRESVGFVQMKVGEGLVGKTLEWLKPVSLARGKKSRSFKFFPETGEEKFQSFLSVPLIHNRRPMGVLVVQNRKATKFSARSAHLLMTLAIPAVNVIEKTKLLGKFGQVTSDKKEGEGEGAVPAPRRRGEGLLFKGIGASPGIAIAKIKIVRRSAPRASLRRDEAVIHADVEKMRVLEAFRWVEEEIRDTQKKAEQKFGMEEISIFDAYKMVLESDPFKEQILEEVDKGKSALKAVEAVIQRYTEELSMADDEYLRERAYDIQDLGRKIIDRLLYGAEVPGAEIALEEDKILFSEFWSISDFVEMDLSKTKGILSPSGGASSHIAILAESLGLPAVLGISTPAENIQDGDLAVIDGSSGIVIVNPDEGVLHAYERESREDFKAQRKYREGAHKRVGPIGGKKLSIGANMGMMAHLQTALDNGVEEIGLYRTEFPFLIRRNLPTEEEQYLLYRKVLEAMGRRPVTIRTLDIGGDKYLPYLNLPREANPFLGWRSIRISLAREDLFRIQLKAMLRASPHGRMRMLFPMITSIEEVRRVKEIVADVKRELQEEEKPFARNVPIGIMIEVPSAVVLAEFLIKEVDFFSIGTNDLIQYTLAVDRNNAQVAGMYNPLHPAVLRAIKKTVDTAHRAKKPVSVCGEMAGQTMGVALLVGMGVDSLSMSAPLASKIKSFVGRLKCRDVRRLAHQAVAMDSAEKIRELVDGSIKKWGLGEFLPHAAPMT